MKASAAGMAFGLLAGSLALAAPAAAHHNLPELVVDAAGDCGEVALQTTWREESHQVHNAMLVVVADGDLTTTPVGEPVTVGPFEAAQVTVRYRVWGGGERAYDAPQLSDLPALLEYLARGGSPVDLDAPGVDWFELPLTGCPPEEQEKPEQPEEQEKPGEPGEELSCIDVNTASFEELQLLKHVGEDRATQIIELRPFSSIDDLGRVHGLAAGGERLAELVAGGGDFLPLCEIVADGEPGGAAELPLTGATTGLLVAGAATLLATGGALSLLARRRRTGFAA